MVFLSLDTFSVPEDLTISSSCCRLMHTSILIVRLRSIELSSICKIEFCVISSYSSVKS